MNDAPLPKSPELFGCLLIRSRYSCFSSLDCEILLPGSFQTIMMQKGASTEFIKDSVGHANVKTTENYLASFDEEIKREFTGKL